MLRHLRERRFGGYLALGTAACLTLAAGWALASSGGGAIHACAAKRSGTLRLARKCKKGERAVSWNVQGPPGERGAPGAPGTPATTLFAFVHEDGTLVRGTPGTTAQQLGSGFNIYYKINFPVDVSKCVPEVSIGNGAGNGTVAGMPYARMYSDVGLGPNSAVEVGIQNPAGSGLIAGAFNLIVIC